MKKELTFVEYATLIPAEWVPKVLKAWREEDGAITAEIDENSLSSDQRKLWKNLINIFP